MFRTIRSFPAARRTAVSVLSGGLLLAAIAFPATAAAVTPTCNGVGATIVGQPGQATVRGTQGPDVIVALEPGVRVDGRGGDDIICTDVGDNIVNGGAGNDYVFSGPGNDTVDGGSGDDAIWGGPGDDTLLGGTGNDTVLDEEGNNLISVGAGDDWVVAGPGDDRIDGGKDSDFCDGGGGTDYVGHCES